MTSVTSESGVVFDWDGVVVDSHDLHERSWEALAEELGAPLPEGFFKQTFGMRNQQVIPGFTSWAGPDETERIAQLARRKEALYRDLVRRDGIRLLPGVAELVDRLVDAGFPLAIGTSAPRENLLLALTVLELEQKFAAVVTAEDVARGKPDPEVFLRCAHCLGRAPERCIVLEDAPAGVRAARAAGMRVVAVSTTHPAAELREADLVVADLTQLLSLDWIAGS